MLTVAEFKRDLKQLGLLLWKNYRLQIKSPIGLVLEILVPALFAFILLPIRSIVKSEEFKSPTVFGEFSVNQLPRKFFNKSLFLAYQPNNSELVNEIIRQVGNNLLLKPIGFADENEMVKYSVDNREPCLGAISFTTASKHNLDYKIRLSYAPKNAGLGAFNPDKDWKTNLLYTFFPVLGPREKNQTEGGDPGYYREGFLALQNAIDMALISEHYNENEKIDLKLKRFPYPPYNDDKFIAVIVALFPFIIMLSFIFTVILTAKAIVYEKETGIKEAMKLMGMKPWIYWLSWYIKTFVILLPSLIIMIVSYKIKLTLPNGAKGSIIDKTDPVLFTIFLVLYASTTITFTFLCTTFFKKANSAAAGAGIIWFFTYLPYIFISLRYEKMNLFSKIIACFVNNLAMSEGVQLIGMFEGKGTGINFSNWTSGVSVDDSFSLIIVMSVMVVDNFIHLILLYYFDNVLPGGHGIAKRWYFPVACFFRRKSQVESSIDLKNINNADNHEMRNIEDQVFIEDESNYSARKIGIQIKQITKIFKQLGQTKKAVNNLSLNIYEGQISVLLGHNGAGKSTTISMITGLAEPTNGKIFINDIDIVENTKEARRCIGFCPQYNLLFDDLTVYEHLKFFSKLKENFSEKEIDNILELINLSDKKNAMSKTLSGGMKRKLSVAIAFIGNSSIVILDEPSSGMDPQARHSTWSLLQKFKKERKCTILLTTHFMDEADFLGDRIAIMSKGTLRCCGSPLYLKSKYGSGYNLILSKKKNNEQVTIGIDNSFYKYDDKIINLVKSIIPNSELSSNVNSEISFILPSQDTDKFSQLFNQLETNKEKLNVLNIGISVTTVEDVFLKIGEYEQAEEESIAKKLSISNKAYDQSPKSSSHDLEKRQQSEELENYGLWTGSKPEHLVTGFMFIIQQFRALFMKRFIHSIRNKTLVISQLIVPIATLLINLIYLKYAPIKPEDSPPLRIDLSQYAENIAPYILTGQKSSPVLLELSSIYENQFKNLKNTQVFNLDNFTVLEKCSNSRSSIDEYMTCLASVNFNYITDKTVLSATFDSNMDNISLIGHFNNQPYHVPPLALNYLTNTLLKFYSKSNNSSITVTNHPLPRNITEIINDIFSRDQTSFNVASGLTFGFSFLIASFAIMLIKEKNSNSKHLQYMSGCNSHLFWISALIWDMFNYMIPTAVVLIILKAFGIEEFVGGVRWLYFLLILIIYGFAHIPQAYLFSYKFKVSATGFAAITAWNILSSQATLAPVNILSLPQLELSDVARILEWIFLIIFPNYALGQATVDLYVNYKTISFCEAIEPLCPLLRTPCCRYKNKGQPKPCGESECLYWNKNYLSWEKPGLLRFIVFMILQFIIQFGIILMYEAGWFGKLKYFFEKLFKRKQQNIKHSQADLEKEYGDIRKDDDVINEEVRISDLINSGKLSSCQNGEIFVVDRLTKYYSDFMAVKGISFTLKPSECFGLLGVNGAGKSTSFKMLTGDEYITKGDAFIKRTSIKENIKKFQKQLGYCPQFDPLIDQMTVMETMKMFSFLRGIKSELVEKTCLSLINLLDLNDHVNKMCYTLSGGNKRKLSVAISLVGSPLVVLLDEPTSGMDPITRRTLWNCLNKIKNKGKSLILTTHSMDETEVLCSNIGIMVNGELKCLGSLQHLKSKYGEGYTLLAKISQDNQLENTMDSNNKKINDFIEYIKNKFPNSILKESRDGFVNIHVNDNSTLVLSNLFASIENIKSKYSIEYYVVTQTKLEQIFLNFASKQIDPETRIIQNKGIFKCC